MKKVWNESPLLTDVTFDWAIRCYYAAVFNGKL